MCPELLQLVHFSFPDIILRQHYARSKNYGKNLPIERSLDLTNKHKIELFSIKFNKFKKTII